MGRIFDRGAWLEGQRNEAKEPSSHPCRGCRQLNQEETCDTPVEPNGNFDDRFVPARTRAPIYLKGPGKFQMSE
jgi:hypothetical protein